MSFSKKSIRAPDSGRVLKIWTEWHALAVGLALLGVLSDLPIALFPAVAALSFLVLILQFRTCWTPIGRFGSANAITLFRLFGVFSLFSMLDQSPAWIGWLALFVFAMDAVDGWVARKWRLSSEFGEFFDKEVDAFFLLTLCLLLYTGGRSGIWILIPGLLRYLFVACLKFIEARQIKEPRSRFGCWSYFLTMFSLISAFIVPDTVYEALTLAMTFVLCASFADTIRRMQWKPDLLHEPE
ncbi:MAG: CDP-alcohol phosphatidyltransferase family protein [Methylococcales bacterium]